MRMTLEQLGIDRLSPEQRLELIGLLWDSLPEDAPIEIPESHKRELERRLADADANPDHVVPWEEVRAQAQARCRRIQRELTPEEQERLCRDRELIAAELPTLMQRGRLMEVAREQATLSGALRRAIHASRISLTRIAERAGITPLALDEFLTGERTLRSDVLDRLAGVVGYTLQPRG